MAKDLRCERSGDGSLQRFWAYVKMRNSSIARRKVDSLRWNSKTWNGFTQIVEGERGRRAWKWGAHIHAPTMQLVWTQQDCFENNASKISMRNETFHTAQPDTRFVSNYFSSTACSCATRLTSNVNIKLRRSNMSVEHLFMLWF